MRRSKEDGDEDGKMLSDGNSRTGSIGGKDIRFVAKYRQLHLVSI